MPCKVFEKLVNNRPVDYLEMCVLFSDGLYGFRSSWSTADLLTVVSDRIARACSQSGATVAVAFDVSKAFDRVWHADYLQKHKSYRILSQIYCLIFFFSVIDSFGWFWLGSLHENIQVMLEFLKALFLVLHFSYYILMNFLMMLSKVDSAFHPSEVDKMSTRNFLELSGKK